MQFFNKNKLNTGLNGEFLDDDEEKGINGTVVDAKLLNGLGHEIENIIKAGGMTPSENENDQLLRAIKNLGGSGVSSSAENVSYNNSISGLQQKNYDFPKIKTPIDNLTYIYLTESSIMGKIEKEENNYFLKGNVSVISDENILLISINIDDKNEYEILSFLCQFFNIDYEARDIENVNWIDALENEIIVNGINNGWQFVFVKGGLAVKRKDSGELPENTYSVTLNIKNRVLLKPDENIIAWQYGISKNILLKIVNENGTAKIKGITNIYSNVRNEETIFFTNNILENYIDLETEHTSGIVSNSGKNVIWSFKKNYQDLPYSIVIKYEDGSQIQENDFFAINITSDKNSDISFTKGDAINVQNAIDSIAEVKQYTLTAGENIVIEKQGEKTIIKSLGGGDAEGISFDNSKTNLEYLSKYDFPKFKNPIADTINLVLTNGVEDYNAFIQKQEDSSYRLVCNLDNYEVSNQIGAIQFFIKSIDSNSNIFQIYSIFSQFFEFVNIDNEVAYNLETDECSISNISGDLTLVLGFNTINNPYFIIGIKSTPITQGTYNIRLNIKNRVLRPADRNIFGITSGGDTFALNLQQNSGTVKLAGTVKGYAASQNGLQFYSEIVENYFNIGSIDKFINTTEITSSTGKAVKYNIYRSGNRYGLILAYQNGTQMQQGDVFTFNLTPDKNSTLDPVYQDVDNVQDAVDVLSKKNVDLQNQISTEKSRITQEITNRTNKDTELLNKINELKAVNIKIDTVNGLSASNVQQGLQALNNKINGSIFNLIPNGNEYKHPTELFNGKPVYYRVFYNSSGWSNTAVVGTVSNVDSIINDYNTTSNGETSAIGDYAYSYNYSTKQIKYFDGDSGRKGKQIIFKYTKTTDSKIL